MKRKIYKSIGIILMFHLLVGISAVHLFSREALAEKADKWPKGPKNISAASAIVMDINTGMILYEKNIHEKQYPASITKILTTLLCIENSSLSDTVKFSEEAVFGIEPGSSQIGIDVGEKIRMEDCLYGIMLRSANEACNGVAEHVSGDIKSFVKLMNQRAKELGCENTHFVNTNGLFHENHYTTAYDMALISKKAIQNEVFRKITGTKRYDIPKTNKKEARSLYNKHQMLNPGDNPQYRYEYTIGGKTGYTILARWTLVTYAKKGDMELLCVVMRTEGPPPNEPNHYTDTIKLLNFGFENYTKYDTSEDTNLLLGESSSLFTNYNPLFNKNESPLYMEEDTGIVLPNTAKLEDAEQQIEYYENLDWVEGKNTIGRISYTYGGKEVGSSNIIYDTTQTTRLVGSEPVTDKLEEIAEAEWKEQEKGKKEEDEKANRERRNRIIICVVGFLLIVLLVVWLVIRIRNEKRKERYRFYHKRNKIKEKKDLHF